MKHSSRARKNMTAQLKARLTWLQADLKSEKKGLATAKKFCKLLRKNFATSTSYKAYSRGIKDTTRQLAALTILIKRRQRNGEINTIL